MSCYAVGEMDSIYPVWDEVCRRMIESSDLQEWVSLECYRYGREDNPTHNPLAVLLSLYPDSQADWTPIRNHMVVILDSFELWDVAVYIIPDVIFRGFGPIPKSLLPDTACKEKVQAGLSVGLSTAEGDAGTLGGFVEIQHQDGTWKKLGVTCFYVAYPQSRGELPDEDNAGMVSSPSLLLFSLGCALSRIHSNPPVATKPHHPRASRRRDNSQNQPAKPRGHRYANGIL